MSIEQLRAERTEEANIFIDSVLASYDFIDFSARRDISNLIEYLISEYVVSDNITNPNYLENARLWALDAIKIMNQLVTDLVDKKASERAGNIIIDVKEFEKQIDFIGLYVGLFESYDTAYYITREVGIPKHSVLHVHAREYKEFFNVLMFLRNTGKNYYAQ